MRVPVPDPVPPVAALGRVHLVGIGGAGLSGIARLLLAHGVQVSGSDAVDSAALQALRDLGARCHVGHAAEQVGDADTVVVSTAVRADNPEVVEAGRLGLRLLPRSAALESLMQDRTVLAVAGTHGKTTTTALLVAALAAAGVDPSYAVGGELADTGTNAHLGGDLFVAEADESDGAFLVYSPLAAVVTGVDADHLDVWGTPQAYRAAFVGFLDRIAAGGFLVVNTDDPGGAELAAEAAGRRLEVVSVGSGDEVALWLGETAADGAGSRTPTRWRDQDTSVLRLLVPGRHYAFDAALALAVGLRLDLDADRLLAGLASYTGTRRRMELRGEAGGVAVYDSYAHHPVEIAGDLEAARGLVSGGTGGGGRVLVCFQPHLVSRTRAFGAQMGEALGAADEVVVLDVYVARENPEPGIDGALVARAVPLPADRVHYAPDPAPVPTRLAELAGPGDLVLTLGAGDVTELGPKVLDELRNRHGGSLDRA
ncbi:MAG: UDP-N-acetylmuramate--L-alanine ligase [Nocardioidaceae bacterium]|nr:UDP-N-acetylmuramate--L-alanine ligase [Nocardioidaceae bacterium]